VINGRVMEYDEREPSDVAIHLVARDQEGLLPDYALAVIQFERILLYCREGVP